eukprot:2291976-Prymnesium_polylepis.2
MHPVCARSPFPGRGMLDSTDNGYCHGPCGANDQRCKELAAGCGASVADVSSNWGSQRCSEWDIAQGECDLCMQALWCDDSNGFGFNGAIKTANAWMDAFHDAE